MRHRRSHARRRSVSTRLDLHGVRIGRSVSALGCWRRTLNSMAAHSELAAQAQREGLSATRIRYVRTLSLPGCVLILMLVSSFDKAMQFMQYIEGSKLPTTSNKPIMLLLYVHQELDRECSIVKANRDHRRTQSPPPPRRHRRRHAPRAGRRRSHSGPATRRQRRPESAQCVARASGASESGS